MPDILVVLELTGELRISQKLDVTFSKLLSKKIHLIKINFGAASVGE